MRSALATQIETAIGQLPEWPNGADCNSAGASLRWFESITAHDKVYVSLRLQATQSTNHGQAIDKVAKYAEVAQLIEHQPSKLRVAGLSPVFRSKVNKRWVEWHLCRSIFVSVGSLQTTIER